MKIKIVAAFLFLNVSWAEAQEGFQSLYNGKIKVKCECKLETNTELINSAKGNPSNNLEAAYICIMGKSMEDALVYNINVLDESKSYAGIREAGYTYFEKKYLEQYEKNLKSMGLRYRRIVFQGVDAIEYEHVQTGIPSKAIMFIKGKKSFLLQVGSFERLSPRFESLKSNFKLTI